MARAEDDSRNSGGGTPVAYLERTRAYYAAQGFRRPYRYAHHKDAPFTPLTRPLAACRIGVVTTASLRPRAPLEPRRVASAPTSPAPARLYGDDLSWDKQATHLDDVDSFCPIGTLQALARQSFIGSLARRFHCAPTEYSQRMTVEQDAPELLERLRDDQVDAVLLVPL